MATLSRQSKQLNLEMEKDSTFSFGVEIREGLVDDYPSCPVEDLPLVDLTGKEIKMVITPIKCNDDELIPDEITLTPISLDNGIITFELLSSLIGSWEFSHANYKIVEILSPDDQFVYVRGKIDVFEN